MKITIRKLLTGMAVLSLLASTILGGTAIWLARKAAAEMERVQLEAVEPAVLLQQMQSSLKDVGYRNASVAAEIMLFLGSSHALTESRAAIPYSWDTFKEIVKAEDIAEEIRPDFEQLTTGMTGLDAKLEKLAQAYKNDDLDAARDFLENDWLDIYAETLKPIEKLLPHFQDRVHGIFAETNARAQQSLYIVLAILAITFLMVSLSAWWLSRRILSRVAESRRVVESVAQFDFSKAVHVSGDDELSALQVSLKDMQTHLRDSLAEVGSVVDAISRGNFNLRVTGHYQGALAEVKDGVNGAAERVAFMMKELTQIMAALEAGRFDVQMDSRVEGELRAQVDRAMGGLSMIMAEINAAMGKVAHGQFNVRVQAHAKGMLAELKQSINDSLDSLEGAIMSISLTVGELAEGNLASRVEGDFSGELASLKVSLDAAIGNMEGAVAEVITSAVSVKNVSGEMAQGSADLMNRTQIQAASIEQTAASMDELSSTVRNNTDSARAADKLAMDARREAESGAAVMRDSVAAMNAMRDAAHRIEEIIALIDGIAFQTNILALNAAVEAARAGEHGRGFAVVASEVRHLAQRSADAAKDIKGLIATTSTRIDEGAHLVEQSGQALDRIHDGIRKVSEIVAEIARASQEQSTGIAQVSQAVGTMDQNTQQNAALVEETAAAAENLRLQADELQRLSSRFKVRGAAAVSLKALSKIPAAAQPIRPAPSKPATTARPSDDGGDWVEF